MLGVALTFVPLVIATQVWVHFLFKDKVRERDLGHERSIELMGGGQGLFHKRPCPLPQNTLPNP